MKKKNKQISKQLKITLFASSYLLLAFFAFYSSVNAFSAKASTQIFGTYLLEAIGYDAIPDSGTNHYPSTVVRVAPFTSKSIKVNQSLVIKMQDVIDLTGQSQSDINGSFYIVGKIINVNENNTFNISFSPNPNGSPNYDFSLNELDFVYVRDANIVGEILYSASSIPVYIITMLTIITLGYLIYYLTFIRLNYDQYVVETTTGESSLINQLDDQSVIEEIYEIENEEFDDED